jgi:hypothetical protein
LIVPPPTNNEPETPINDVPQVENTTTPPVEAFNTKNVSIDDDVTNGFIPDFDDIVQQVVEEILSPNTKDCSPNNNLDTNQNKPSSKKNQFNSITYPEHSPILVLIKPNWTTTLTFLRSIFHCAKKIGKMLPNYTVTNTPTLIDLVAI